jgi:glycosyltransferase involved in cell wall biosynthesis
MIDDISVVIIVKNGEKTIKSTITLIILFNQNITG